MVAGLARGPKDSAAQLKKYHDQITDLLCSHGINPLLGSSDGTDTKQAMQFLAEQSADGYKVYIICNSILQWSIQNKIPLFGGFPMIFVQDSKHALKTAQNQLLTGARILALGWYAIFYSLIRTIATTMIGPLFQCDVEKVDKQDDHAAARLFSSQTLDFQCIYQPQEAGLSAYLFILGELVDAWQNHKILHKERVKMALRSRFFLHAWRAHMDRNPDHSVNVQFISHKSFNIFTTLCDSLIALIVTHCDYYPHYFPGYTPLKFANMYLGSSGSSRRISIMQILYT